MKNILSKIYRSSVRVSLEMPCFLSYLRGPVNLNWNLILNIPPAPAIFSSPPQYTPLSVLHIHLKKIISLNKLCKRYQLLRIVTLHVY